jgi:hypothetical protein
MLNNMLIIDFNKEKSQLMNFELSWKKFNK